MKQNQIIKKFNKDGFVIIKNLVDKQTVSNILSEIPKIQEKVLKKNQKFSHKTKLGKFNSIHNINSFYRTGKIYELSKSKLILKLAKNFLNDLPQLRNIEFFLKPLRNQMITPFHQDNFFWNLKDANGINIWIACSNASKKNGGVCYLKESHTLGVLKHKISFIKGTSQMIPEKIIKKLKFKKIFPNLKPGDAIIHNPEVIHGSYKNNSNTDRVGLVLSFKGKNSKYNLSALKNYKSLLKKNIKKIYKKSVN